ncbi:MAG: hypothetical protein GWO24_34940, partial [Akkermansiaceae bacterium]|nr:hypothetical protein [Akkermansiaceae bacterium]
AGSGARDDCNDWLSVNEGAPALLADLSRPHMASADAAGNIYIADKEAYSIRKVDLDGDIHTVAGTGTFGVPFNSGTATEMKIWAPNGIHVFPDGSFYFLTINENCESETVLPGGKIHKVTPDGTMTTVVNDPQLTIGRGLYVTKDESTIYYCSGTLLKKWTSSGGIQIHAGGFKALGNIDLEASGSLLVTDRLDHKVWRVQPSGSKAWVAGNGKETEGGHGSRATATGLDEVRGVAVLDTGGYFLCTHKGDQVWYVDTSGYIWVFVNPTGDKGHAGDGLPV